MKKQAGTFLAGLLAYAGVLFLLWIFLRSSLPLKFYYPKAWFLILFFFVTTSLFHYGLLRSAEKNNSSVIRYYMMSTAVKLFLYFLVMVGYALTHPGYVIPFIANFFVLYILFTAFEVTAAYRHFRSVS